MVILGEAWREAKGDTRGGTAAAEAGVRARVAAGVATDAAVAGAGVELAAAEVEAAGGADAAGGCWAGAPVAVAGGGADIGAEGMKGESRAKARVAAVLQRRATDETQEASELARGREVRRQSRAQPAQGLPLGRLLLLLLLAFFRLYQNRNGSY